MQTIALEKDGQGTVTPIGIEVLRRVIGKTVSKLLKADVDETDGVRQNCGGQEDDIVAAIQGATKIYGLTSTECMLQIDASNAFDNREWYLHNAQFICPKIHCYLMNAYQKAARPFIRKGRKLQSQEGTIQEDNIARGYNAIGMKHLMDRLDRRKIVLEWFADEVECLSEILPVKKWWDQINEFGRNYGYFPKASKCRLICKSEEIATEAKRIFGKNRKEQHSNRTETFGSRYRWNTTLQEVRRGQKQNLEKTS